jgi:hypothetical protein
MSGYTNNISEEEQWAKINIDRKRPSYIKKDCFEKSQNYCGTGDSRTEYVFILKPLFPQTLSDVSFTNPTSTARLQLLNLRLLNAMFRCVNHGVTTINPEHQTNGNVLVMWSDESTFTLFATSGRVYVWRTTKEAHNPECLVPTVKHGKVR